MILKSISAEGGVPAFSDPRKSLKNRFSYRSRPGRRQAHRAGTSLRGPAHALAHVWPGRHAHHAGQGDGQLRSPPAARARIAAVVLNGKINGAVGNYNAHLAAYRLGDRRPALRRSLRARLQSLHHPDRAARQPGGAVRRLCCSQHRAARPRSRRVGLHLARLLPAARPGGRSGLFDHAVQGQPDRLRKLRGQHRHRQRAAAPSEQQAAGLPLAARPVGSPPPAWRGASKARHRRRGWKASKAKGRHFTFPGLAPMLGVSARRTPAVRRHP